MTCHELRLYFEDPLRMDAKSPRVAEHLDEAPVGRGVGLVLQGDVVAAGRGAAP